MINHRTKGKNTNDCDTNPHRLIAKLAHNKDSAATVTSAASATANTTTATATVTTTTTILLVIILHAAGMFAHACNDAHGPR